MPSNSTVLLLSNDFLFGEGLRSFLLKSNQYQCFEKAAVYADFERYVKELNPDLIVLDLSSTVFKVEKVIAYVGFTTQSKILLLGEELTQTESEQMRQWGAHAIAKKSSSEIDLEQCLKALGEGRFFIPEDVTKPKEANGSDLMSQLNISEREREIIKLIAEGHINKEIADQLFLSTHTVNTHRKNIMQKLGINNTAGIVLFAVKENIVSPNEFLFH